MNIRDKHHALALARVYLDGNGYTATNEASKSPGAWVSDSLRVAFLRGRLIGALLHAIGVYPQSGYGADYWASREDIRRLGIAIGQRRGLFLSGKMKPPGSMDVGDVWPWLIKLLTSLGLEVDTAHCPSRGLHLRVNPLSVSKMLAATQPAYERFSPNGGQPNYSEVNFMDFGILSRPSVTNVWLAAQEEAEATAPVEAEVIALHPDGDAQPPPAAA